MVEITKKQADKLVELRGNLEGNLGYFGAYLCPDIILRKIPEFHMDLCRLLQTEDRLVLAAPRGFSKSCWVSKIFPLQQALFKKKKDILIISASEGLATEHLRWVKQQVESSENLNLLFGNLVSSKWSETHIILQHKDGTQVNVRAKGAGGQIRGFRPDCIILDDIETDELVESEDQRKKLKKWLFTACINCLLPGGQLILIGTVIHPLSVLADLLDTPNGWVKRRWKAYKDGVEAEGSELWAEERSHEWLQQRKAEIGSFSFASEYMNDPKLDAEAPIKPEYIRYWEELPNQLGAVMAFDPAYSEDAKSDYKVAVLVGMDQKNNRYLIDYIRTHNPTGDFIDQALNLFLRHKNIITAVGVPAGREKEFYDKVIEKAQLRNITIPIIEVKNVFVNAETSATVRNKKRRITAALQPLFEQGRYYIHANHNEAREELLTIGSSRWDDVVDAMTYAEQIVTPVYFDENTNEKLSGYNEHDDFGDGYGIEY